MSRGGGGGPTGRGPEASDPELEVGWGQWLVPRRTSLQGCSGDTGRRVPRESPAREDRVRRRQVTVMAAGSWGAWHGAAGKAPLGPADLGACDERPSPWSAGSASNFLPSRAGRRLLSGVGVGVQWGSWSSPQPWAPPALSDAHPVAPPGEAAPLWATPAPCPRACAFLLRRGS